MRELIRAEKHDRNRSLGWLVLAWIERHCVHGPGDVQGIPLDPDKDGSLPIDDEFAAFIVDAYALDETGRRLYDSAFFSRAKGRAKSELAGWLSLAESLGPVRFAGWARGGETATFGNLVYTYEAGEPMGRTVTYPYIRCLATEEGQAGNTYDNIYFNLNESETFEVYGLSKTDIGLTRINLPGGGMIVPSTASSSAKDGGKETFVVFDESHLYNMPELRRMYGTVTRNLDKRKDAEPWSLETSTMYAPGEDSIAEQSHKYARSILEGKTKANRLLFDHRQADPKTDLTDHDSLIEGLKESYGPASAWMDLERMVQSIWDVRRSVSDSRRYFLNQPTAAADAWLTEPEWDSCSAADKTVEPGELIALGFDGSQKRSRGVADATALMGCRISDGHVFTIRVWEQPDGPDGDGWRVPISEVKDAVKETFDTYEVVAFYADPAKWEGVVAEWELEYGPQLRVKNNSKNPIEWWMTGARGVLVSRALERFHNAVIDQEMTHDGSLVLKRHALNARRQPGPGGIQIKKEHPQSPKKIDAVVASVLAFEARADALAQGVTRHKRRARVLAI